MKKLKQILSSTIIAVMLSVLAMPALVLADDTTTPTDTTQSSTTPDPSTTQSTDPSTTTATDPSTTTPTDPSTTTQPASTTGPTTTTGPTQPTGPTKPTGPIPTYAFDSKTGTWVATNQASFYWDSASGNWLSPYYSYDSRSGWYYVNYAPEVSGSAGVGGQATGIAANDPMLVGASSDSTKAKLAALLGIDPSNSNTGPNSVNNAILNNNASALFNILALASITNGQTSTSTTGDANVTNNTNAGDASTGMANVVSNFLNLINSGWTWGSGTLAYFVDNIFGNHTGDVTLNPTMSGSGGGGIGCYFCFSGVLDSNSNTGPNSQNTAQTNANKDLTVNYQPNGSITNNIDLLAQSGNANIDANTNAGNAKTGDAAVELNLVNMINSAIGAGGSFFGMVNIFGDLNGDILFPAGFLDSLIGGNGGASGTGGGSSATASNTNTGAGSNNTANSSSNLTGNITDTSQSTFNNNLRTGAQSGDANVDQNTIAGAATTGNATTNTNTYNLDNESVVGDNAVLVLVNVLGHWMGAILNLPSTGGSQSGLLGGNTTVSNNGTGPGSTNNASSSTNGNLDVNYSPTSTINNNINAGAISGDASVTRNTNAGSATSGNAGVAANVVNILGSHLNLKHWFGVLVVNVFGNWFGSVGQDTAAGNAAAVGGGTIPTTNGPTSTSAIYYPAPSGGSAQVTTNNTNQSSGNISIAAASNVPNISANKKAANKLGLLFGVMALLLLGSGALLGIERKVRAHKN